MDFSLKWNDASLDQLFWCAYVMWLLRVVCLWIWAVVCQQWCDWRDQELCEKKDPGTTGGLTKMERETRRGDHLSDRQQLSSHIWKPKCSPSIKARLYAQALPSSKKKKKKVLLDSATAVSLFFSLKKSNRASTNSISRSSALDHEEKEKKPIISISIKLLLRFKS